MKKEKEPSPTKILNFIEKNTTEEQRKIYRAISALASMVTEGSCTIPLLVETLYKRFDQATQSIKEHSTEPVHNMTLSKGEIARQLRVDGLLDYLEDQHYIEIHKDDILVTGAGLAVGWRMHIMFLTNREFTLASVAGIINMAIHSLYKKELDPKEKFNLEEVTSIKNTIEAMMFKPSVMH